MVVNGAFVPAFKLKEFPGRTFVCDEKEAGEWKILETFASGSSTVAIGRTANSRRVRLLTKKLSEDQELVLDLKQL